VSARLESLLTPTQRAEAEAADMAERNGLPPALAGVFIPLVIGAHLAAESTPMDWLEEEAIYERMDARQEARIEARDEREEREGRF
jgi:hypothetical protein